MSDEIRTQETNATENANVDANVETKPEAKPETKKPATKKRKAPFTQAQVDAVATQHWWRVTADSTMCKKVNIDQSTLEKIRESSAYLKSVESLMLGQRTEADFNKWVTKYPEKDMPKDFSKRMHIKPEAVMPMVNRVRAAHKAIASGKRKAPKMLKNPYARS